MDSLASSTVSTVPDGRLATTQSICPRCKLVLDAELLERDGRVLLSRTCPEHGLFEALVYGDAERYTRDPALRQARRGAARAPDREPRAAARTTAASAPSTPSTPASAIIEVNTACNLDCPICFADSGTGLQEHGFSLSLEQVESMLDSFVRAEGEPESVQLSGGEPSIHPQILDDAAAPPAIAASRW